MTAIWGKDYDSRTDSIYKRPCCSECREPIGLDGGEPQGALTAEEVMNIVRMDGGERE